MKNFKKFAGIMLALVMVLAMAVPVFAETSADTTGSITITPASENQTYKIYKMFDLESYVATEGQEAYTYTVAADSAWKTFADTVVTDDGKKYFKLEESKDNKFVVTINEEIGTIDDSSKAALAKKALEYVNTLNSDGDDTNNIAAAATLDNTNSFKATGLDLGYYLVDSSLGALCGLTTTHKDAEVQEKNAPPTVDKKIEISTDNFAEANTAKIGDTVKFKTTITVKKGAENYVLHDIMQDTFSFNNDIAVTVDKANVDAANYTKFVKDAATNPTTDNHTFDIEFKNDYLKTLAEDTKITVTYSAVLKENAVIAGDGNKNETYLKYGDKDNVNNETAHISTVTKTYSFDLVKTKKDNTVLSGAEFALYDAATGGNQIALVEVAGVDGQYRVATPTETAAADFTSAVVKAGKAKIIGLANGKYYLEETKQPDGYNKLTTRTEVEIKDANKEAAYTDDAKTKYKDSGVQVINLTGSELPSTGGIGTVIFYIVGATLLVGAGVILVVRKRMSAESKTK